MALVSEKQRLLHTYLQHQAAAAGLIKVEDITLEEFKNYVKSWLEADAYIRKAKQLVKEKKKVKNKLSEIIMRFMSKYNIEDLNTKEGRIRYKTTYIRKPVTQKELKEKVQKLVPENKQKYVNRIFEERPKQEKVGLRRLKIK